MNVLLIYPEFPDTFWSFKHALKFVRKRASVGIADGSRDAAAGLVAATGGCQCNPAD